MSDLSTLIVTTPAGTTGLTTVDVVKTELGITDASEDDRLLIEIERASAMICGHVNARPADDGTVTLGREVLLESIYSCKSDRVLRLSRQPIVSVQSVTENGTAVDPADYLIENNAGKLHRLNNGFPSMWSGYSTEPSIVVAYTAGWLLPGDSGRNLPLEIEYAAIALVKGARFSRARDPALQSENILEGLYGYRLFDPSNSSDGIPTWVANLLNRYLIYR